MSRGPTGSTSPPQAALLPEAMRGRASASLRRTGPRRQPQCGDLLGFLYRRQLLCHHFKERNISEKKCPSSWRCIHRKVFFFCVDAQRGPRAHWQCKAVGESRLWAQGSRWGQRLTCFSHHHEFFLGTTVGTFRPTSSVTCRHQEPQTLAIAPPLPQSPTHHCCPGYAGPDKELGRGCPEETPSSCGRPGAPADGKCPCMNEPRSPPSCCWHRPSLL